MKKSFALLTNIVISVIACAQSTTTIYFDSNADGLKRESVHTLDSIKNVLSQSNHPVVEIYGYCDNSGTTENNKKLSELRALTVFNYLSQPNISMLSKGEGENNPVADNISESGKAKNRRVEIIIQTKNHSTDENSRISNKTEESTTQTTNPTSHQSKAFSSASKIEDMEIGSTLVLQNLNFEGGTAVLLPEAKPTLELLVKTMKDNPTLKIEIGGHVCCFDDMPLSVRRALVVLNYLKKKGIDEERMTYKGYSRDKPIFEDDRDEAKAKVNRRVEITILGK